MTDAADPSALEDTRSAQERAYMDALVAVVQRNGRAQHEMFRAALQMGEWWEAGIRPQAEAPDAGAPATAQEVPPPAVASRCCRKCPTLLTDPAAIQCQPNCVPKMRDENATNMFTAWKHVRRRVGPSADTGDINRHIDIAGEVVSRSTIGKWWRATRRARETFEQLSAEEQGLILGEYLPPNAARTRHGYGTAAVRGVAP